MIRPHHIALLALATTASACSTDEDPTAPIDIAEVQAPLEERTGSFLAEYNGGSGTMVHAQFLNVQGISGEQAFEALEVWSPDRELAADACSVRSVFDSMPSSETVRLELIDVGPITISFETGSVALAGRRLPDMLTGVSGVVYGNEEGFDFDGAYVPFVPGGSYRIQAPGDSMTGGFDVEIMAPESPQLYFLGAGELDETRTANAVQGQDVELRWTASADTMDADLYLDVASTLGPDRPRLRCHLEDDGAFTIPEGVIEQLRDDSANLEVTLRRVHVVDANIEGIDSSEVLFSATDGATLILP